MIVAPPGEPVPMTNSPRALPLPLRNTSVGAIELRGRLPAATRLAIRLPLASVGAGEKSVSWLFSRKPRVMWNEPMPDSTVVVMRRPRCRAVDDGDVRGAGFRSARLVPKRVGAQVAGLRRAHAARQC